MDETNKVMALHFSPWEAEWIDRFLTETETLPQRLSTLLQRPFFNQEKGRALILQPGRGFGYFYLKSELYAETGRLERELKALLDLCSLIARLREHRLIYLLGTGHTERLEMVFFSDLFDSPKACKGYVILNPRGDITFDPQTIQNEAEEVIYRGTRLDGAVFRLVHDCVDGMMCIPDDCRRQLRALLAASDWQRTRQQLLDHGLSCDTPSAIAGARVNLSGK